MPGKKLIYLIAPKDFRDEEYSIPKGILEGAGHSVVTASLDRKLCRGMFGLEVMPALKANEVKPFFYDGIVIAGGQGASSLWESEDVLKLVREFFAEKKLTSAICIAPVVLAKAGILSGRKATVWSSTLDRKGIDAIRASGATYLPTDVVRDGIIVTGNGPEAAKKFAERILEVLGK